MSADAANFPPPNLGAAGGVLRFKTPSWGTKYGKKEHFDLQSCGPPQPRPPPFLLLLLFLGATPLEACPGSASLSPPTWLAPSWQSLPPGPAPGQSQSRAGAGSLQDLLRPSTGRPDPIPYPRWPQTRLGPHHPLLPAPSSHCTDHSAPLPSCLTGTSSQAAGWGRGEVSYSSWGDTQGAKNTVYMARLLLSLQAQRGLLEEAWQGYWGPNIPINRCGPGTSAFLPLRPSPQPLSLVSLFQPCHPPATGMSPAPPPQPRSLINHLSLPSWPISQKQHPLQESPPSPEPPPS